MAAASKPASSHENEQDQNNVQFKDQDVKRKEHKQHVDYPKTHMPTNA
eukprot:CAMPEP_0197251486 /NCGR_PEP_ID=MMETSP1429-20130617/57371_1 /TAXON_ID=49237 /ORGANISM="Chaetoceros  sp., Strain UNC1202" /LENGTH=47 /DNA_ID= /DNA_START= /DNA_END= /DNA_ORIENTATION=